MEEIPHLQFLDKVSAEAAENSTIFCVELLGIRIWILDIFFSDPLRNCVSLRLLEGSSHLEIWTLFQRAFRVTG